MMPTTVTGKSMTIGEGGTALAFVALAVSSIFVAARCLSRVAFGAAYSIINCISR
jgi:hypothetical protein